jgi:hypothetical protein
MTSIDSALSPSQIRLKKQKELMNKMRSSRNNTVQKPSFQMNVSGSTVFSSQNLHQKHMFVKPGGSGLTFHEKEPNQKAPRELNNL